MGIQGQVPESAHQEAALHGAASVQPVRNLQLPEMQAFVVQGKRTGNMVAYPGEIDLEQAIVQPEAATVYVRLFQSSVQPDVSAEETAELGKDIFQERCGVPHVEAVHVGGSPDGTVGGPQEPAGVDVVFPGQEVRHFQVEAFVGLVPIASDTQLAHPLAGDIGGVALDVGHKADGRRRGGEQQGFAGCVAFQGGQ